jgi:hypothetical protein
VHDAVAILNLGTDIGGLLRRRTEPTAEMLLVISSTLLG